MASDIKIDVTVQISEMLKAMFGCCDVPNEPADPFATETRPDLLAEWKTLRLRRDGQRPMQFIGMPLLERRCIVADVSGRIEQTLSFYLDRDGAVIASLAFVPSETRAAWPSFRCKAINSLADLAQFLEDWQPEQCFWQSMSAGTSLDTSCVADPQTARSSFKSMTADCLSPAVLQG